MYWLTHYLGHSILHNLPMVDHLCVGVLRPCLLVNVFFCCIVLLCCCLFLFPFALLLSHRLHDAVVRCIIGRSIKAESFKNTVCQRSGSSLLVRT